MRTHLRLVAMLLSLFAAHLEAGEFAVGDMIDLALPDGLPSFSLSIVAAPPAGIAGQSYIARDTRSQASAVVKPTSDGLRVTIDDFENQKIYSVRVKDGVVSATVRDTSGDNDVCGTCGGDLAAPPQEAAPAETNAASTITPRTSRLKSAMLGTSDAFPFAEQKAVVDILVAFDQGAKAKCTELGFDGIDDFADYAVNKMNMVLVQSQLDDLFCYRLVGVVEIDDAWNKINDALLGSLRSREGSLAKLSQLREKCGADTITLLVNKTEGITTGVAYGYYLSAGYDVPSKFDKQNYACNVCNINTVYSRYTMSHETGHNMGCGHSNRQGNNSGPGRYSDSCGYHFTDANGVRRCTIMAYTNTGDDNYYYDPVPYFSTPEISPAEYGCALGEEGVNNNRRTLTLTYADIAGLREHVVPYDWDVRVWDGQRELAEGDYCEYDNYGNHTLSLTHTNSDAVIYYTLDGSVPNTLSEHIRSGETISVNLEQDKTMKVCAVIGNTAQSVRTLTLREGIAWSGEQGQSGNGRWSADQNVLSWCGGERPYEKWATVIFPDNVQNQSISIAVIGEIAPWGTAFTAIDTAYTFNKNDAESLLKFRDAAFAPSGDLTFNVPVQMSATSFTTPTGGAIAFNAPFGQVLESSGGYCTNSIVVGNGGTLVVAPGSGKTQTFDSFNNTGNYYSTATLQIGEGKVRFNGPINSGAGLFGSTKISVGDGGNLVFDVGGATGSEVSSTLAVSAGGTVTFNGMEHMRRKLILDGGTVRCKRLDWMYGTTISATADSSIVENGSDGYVWIRFADATVDVADGATLTLDVPITTGYDTVNYGFVKTGGGELAANRPMSHTGATVISNGTLSVGYVSSTRVGLGWTVKNGATLKLKSGCALAVPTLALESGATLAVSATNAAPLSATNEVNLSGVRLLLDGASDLSLGKAYPVLSSTGGFTGVSGVVTDGLPMLADGLEWVAVEEGGTICAKVRATVRTLDIPAGTVVNLSDIPASIETVTGEGTVYCGATLPDASLGWTSVEWKGTIVLEGLVSGNGTKDFDLAPYGNSLSRVLMRNCSIFYFSTTASFAGTLVLDGNDALRLGDNGYSDYYAVFGALEGDGTISAVSRHWQAYVFNMATNYTGSISIGAGNYGTSMNGRRIVFGVASSASDIPSQYASITVKAGATASIGSNATWQAYHGVEIAGTLLVKGAGATLDCNASAAMGLKLDDGATLRFETADAKLAFAKAPQFSAGTVGVAFASGVAPTNGMVLATWPDGSAPAGGFAFSDTALAERWILSKTTTGLVVENAPLPATVKAAITIQYYEGGVPKEKTVDVELPTGWATNYYPSLDTVVAVAAKYDGIAENGARVWQCYMLGLDPTNAESGVSLSMTVGDGKIAFAVKGLGETHAISGVDVFWAMKTSTNLVTDADFTKTRESATGLSPTFTVHDMPDKPTNSSAAEPVDTLFYRLKATFYTP